MNDSTIIGIDLGTTNSEVAVIKDGRPIVLEADGEAILPSVVGLDMEGQLLVGNAARNQYVLAPERTIASIKRKMGEEMTVDLGGKRYSPQEISAIILRTLKDRTERALGHPVSKAVITVPAFFNDSQRQATREAGQLAGLEVVRIINEPTAAILTYDPHPTDLERLLVYDLGGGTFDVSIAQVENGVVEIMASHGDTHLGGDDFDQLLLDNICKSFQARHRIDLREIPVARARLLRAAEEAKKRLSTEAVTTIEEEFITRKDGKALNLVMEITRFEYEELIEPLLNKTLKCLDDALSDAMMQANQIDKVVLVGGATRTPLVHRLLEERLARPVNCEIEPDLAVAMGAAVQGGLIAGIDVGPILVDITPHTLGIAVLGELHGFRSPHVFSPIIPRNTPLPASRTEIYQTIHDGQDAVDIEVFQGEDCDTRYNTLVGEFTVEGLSDVPAGNPFLVRFDLDLNGILKVTATERSTGLAKHIVIDSASERFRKQLRSDAINRLESVHGAVRTAGEQTLALAPPRDDSRNPSGSEPREIEPDVAPSVESAHALVKQAQGLLSAANPEDAAELKTLLESLRRAIAAGDDAEIRDCVRKAEDLVFYLQDA